MAQDLQSLQPRQLQHENQINGEKKERNSHLAILEEELRMIKERNNYIVKTKRAFHLVLGLVILILIKGSLRINDYYQPTPRRTRRESVEIETKVDLPYFYGKENVGVYLDGKFKVEQLFACHLVSEERKVPLTTLSFQNNAMYWWTNLERERLLLEL